MDDRQLLRYSRHILLPDFDLAGQEALLGSSVLLVGAGGLGSPAALYLAASGVGQLTIADGDTVELSNLQRQIIHQTRSIGLNKAESACSAASELNSDIRITAIARHLMGSELLEQVARHDVIVDASDNFATRHAINHASVTCRKPLVSGAALRTSGLLTTFDQRQTDSPCYGCLFPESADDPEVDRCSESGVFSPLTGMIGTLQAAEAIKLVTGWGESLHGRLIRFDMRAGHWNELRLKRDPACPVCSTA